MHSIHVGQRALSLGSWQSGSPRSQSALGKGQAAGNKSCGEAAGERQGWGVRLTSSPPGKSWQLPLGTREGTGGPSGHRVPRPFGGCTECSAAHR